MQKIFFALLFWAACCTPASAQIIPVPSFLVLKTQSDVDSFPLKYGPVEVLPGDLIVGGADSSHYSDISDLSPLASLRFIWGSLVVLYNGPLQSLHGLEALDTVYTNLAIAHNPQLQNLHGLRGLRDVDYQMFIQNNDALQDLVGLDSLHKVSSDLLIKDNDGLQNLQGLGALTQAGYVDILNNDRLESLAGMNRLYQAINIDVSGNNMLKTVAGMDQLEIVDGITLADNDSLDNCAGFPAVHKLFTLRIKGNPRLRNIGNFGPADSLDLSRLYIQDNPRLRTLDGLQRIPRLGEWAYIERNDSLQTLQGLEVDRIGTTHDYARANLYIRDNPLLTDLALNHLRVVGQPVEADNSDLQIQRNRSLKSLTGLASLDSCHARLSILENDSLQTVDLPSLRYGYDILVGIDSVEESRVGPFDHLEYLERSFSAYNAKYMEGFPKLKRVGEST